MITKHTSVPWEIGQRTGKYRVPIASIEALKKAGLSLEFEALSIGTTSGQIAIIPLDESNEANAKFIVRACNTHEALLEALKAMRALKVDRWRDDIFTVVDAERAADAAIAKAEERA